MAAIGGDPRHRDVVVIGSSAGGIEALPRLLSQLPQSFPAAVAIVQHLMPGGSSGLVDILQRSSSLPVQWGEHGDEIMLGRVYVAPAGVHMLFDDTRVALGGGPRENYSRPAINRLFRSAAAQHGNRTIGVLLTGMLDDGVAGLKAIQKAGGAAIVQDPDDAAYPSMPQAALAALRPDRVLPIDAIGAALMLLVRQAAPPIEAPQEVVLEAQLDSSDAKAPTGLHSPEALDALGPQSPIACPECGGPLWQTGDPLSRTYRCYLGHVTSTATMLSMKSTEVERALWSAVRSLQERATTLSRLAQDARRIGATHSASDYDHRAHEAHSQAERARLFLLDLQREMAKAS
jgi:two-component system chemotaxis response regulator CheB